MTGLLIALALAATHALCLTAGYWLALRRNAARLNRLADYERATRRDVEYRQAIPDGWYQQQLDAVNAHAIWAAGQPSPSS